MRPFRGLVLVLKVCAGGKIQGNTQIAVAAAVGACRFMRQVRVALGLHTNMALRGKRLPYDAEYSIGVSKEGRISAIQIDYWVGHFRESVARSLLMAFFVRPMPGVLMLIQWEQ